MVWSCFFYALNQQKRLALLGSGVCAVRLVCGFM